MYRCPSRPNMLNDNDAIDVISNRPYITYLLQRAHGARNGLTIISAPHGINHASSIVEVDEEDNSLLIDALSQGQSIPEDLSEFTVMIEGVRTWFTINKFAREQIGEDVFYRASFPKSLYRVQRRNHYRVAVPMDINSRIQASSIDGSRPIVGVISDISLGGVGFNIPSDTKKIFVPQWVFSRVYIELGDLCTLKADLKVLRVVNSKKNNSMFLGAQYHKLKTSESKKVALAVQELQRIELRNRKR
jgi:c-di-GMP-binding flagellar brake protein YcgR